MTSFARQLEAIGKKFDRILAKRRKEAEKAAAQKAAADRKAAAQKPAATCPPRDVLPPE